MTDQHADLIASLKSLHPQPCVCNPCRAADALELQARRIGELEGYWTDACQLRAERDALARDAERLNWLDKNIIGHQFENQVLWGVYGNENDSIRAAIDAAIAARVGK